MKDFFAYILLLVIFVGLFTFSILNASHMEYNKQFCIESKDISIQDRQSKYLIFTTNNDVLEVTDTLFQGRWNSSNIYASLKQGKCYQADLQGYRIPFLSMYKNIIRPIELRK